MSGCSRMLLSAASVLSLIVLPAFLIVAMPVDCARAQSIADSFGGFSKKNNDPINIEADTLEVVDDKNFAVFSGNVKASQGTFVLRSKKLKVTYSRGKGRKDKSEKAAAKGIKFIDATGKVAISTPDHQSATSDWAKFDVMSRIITIGGNVVLSQGGNVMKGDKLVIDLNTGRSKFHATSKSTGSRKGKRPRITGVFMPGSNKSKKIFGRLKNNKGSPKKKNGSLNKSSLPWQKGQ